MTNKLLTAPIFLCYNIGTTKAKYHISTIFRETAQATKPLVLSLAFSNIIAQDKIFVKNILKKVLTNNGMYDKIYNVVRR